MTTDNQHRLLKRQLKKFNIDPAKVCKYRDFFQAINEAYKSFDKEVLHLENVLELSSKELFVANKQLKEENLTKSREALLLSQKLDKVMDNVMDIIFEMDDQGNFTYLNKPWVKYSEESAEESIGKNYMEFANRIKFFDPKARESIVDGDFNKFKTTYCRYNSEGKLLWWEMSVKILRSDEGVVQGAIGSLVDVTSLKETQEKLIKASKSKDRFLSTMSHEIRTPLNAVIAISNILLMEDPKEYQMENLNALKFSSKHLLNLINDILDYNKMTSEKLTFSSVPFNLRFTVNGIMNSYSYNAQDKGIELITDIKSSVPEGAIGDKTRLSQVLTNLIGNAIKFTSKGSVKLTIDCKSKTQDKIKLSFAIEDTGIGIAADKQEYIFERFTQAEENTSMQYGGTGLGLSISKKIINLLGSDIHVESVVGEGTKFWFDLEFGKVKHKSLLEIDNSIDRKLYLDGVKLLVVDDNAMNLMVIQQFFDKWNITYDEAGNGLEAIDKIKENDYDLVLMDLRMPVMDGYTAAKVLRAMGGKFAQLPIIALSASVSSEVMEKVTNVGMNDYLSKPFDPIDLYNKISLHALKSHYTEVVG